MISNLAYALEADSTAIGSENDGTVFEFNTGSYSAGNTAYIMNWNTAEYGSKWLYSWYAATAGVGKSGDVSKTIDGSICPAGWRLPPNYNTSTGGQVDKSFGNLLAAYGMPATNVTTQAYANILTSPPLNLGGTNRLKNGSTYVGFGYWWSSTASSTSANAYYLYVDTDNSYPQHSTSKTYGFALRCVAL